MIIESISGVRGIIGTGLTPEVVVNYASALGEFIKEGTVVIGRDSRSSGNVISQLLSQALQWQGIRVVDLGIVPTPTVQFMVENMKASAGIAVTASHNPFPWNGLKFIDKTGRFFNGAQVIQLIELKNDKKFHYKTSGQFADAVSYENAIADHIENVLNIPYLDLDIIRQRKFKVVVDAVNGGASEAIPRLLEALNCDIIPLHCIPDGNFPHTPEPLPENLTGLIEAVKQHHADLGMAIDPDGDRLAIVSNEGGYLSEEYTLVMATEAVLSKSQCSDPVVVTNLSTTRAMDDIVAKYNGKLLRTAIGEINVSDTMYREKAVIGGEGNGGVILPDSHLGRDSLVGAALILQFLTMDTEKISTRFKKLPQYRMSKLKVNLNNTNPDAVIAELVQKHSHETLNTIDGLKIEWKDRWVHIRKSNTEPILRVYSEAPTAEEAYELAEQFQKQITDMTKES